MTWRREDYESGDFLMAAKKKIHVPGSELLAYQRDWADDPSRWKFGLMSRQVGKDFSSGFEGIRDIWRAEKEGEKRDWLIAAPSERQSLESLSKWKDWTLAFKVPVAGYKEERQTNSEGLLKSATITFPGGSRVIAVPGQPETVRGFSANVLLTEFAYFEQPEATWRAILPSITNPLRGGAKKVRLITTPNGIGNKAHELWVKNYHGGAVVPTAPSGVPPLASPEAEGGTPSAATGTVALPASQWSCHFVDIQTAVRDGLPVQVEELKAALDDPEGWAQEFECQFLDAQAVLLPYDLITSCESLEATAAVAPQFWQTVPPFPVVMGLDFGRRHDLTVAWSLAQLGDVRQTLEVLEMERTPTPEQVERLRPRLRQARRVCLDYTGPGIGLGDYLVREFGEWNPAQHKFGKIELCNFTNTLKLEIFSKLRMAFEKRALRVPVSRLIREDLHSVNRVSSATGQISYRASHSADGHADRCAALALALRASGEGGPTRISSASVKVHPAIGDMGVGKFRAKDWPM
jgi:phage FluMu gp28-like protein